MMLAGGGVLGDNAIPGDPGALEGYGRQLATAADQIGEIQSRLTNNSLSGDWSGQAADAFRSHLDELPGEIDKIGQSFSEASTIVAGFAHELSGYQQTANWLASRITEATAELRDAEARQQAAQESLASAVRADAAASDPVTKTATQRTLSRATSEAGHAQANLENAAGDLAALEQRAAANHQAWQDTGSAYANRLEALIGGSIQHGFLGWVEHTFSGAGHVIGTAAVWVAKHAEDAALDVVDDVYAPLRRALLVLGDAIAIAQVVVLVVPGLGEVAEAVLDVANFADSAVVLAGDSVLVAQGRKLPGGGDLAEDAVGLGLAFIPGGKEAKLGEDVAKGAGKDIVKTIGKDVSKTLKEASELKTAKGIHKLVAPGYIRLWRTALRDHLSPEDLRAIYAKELSNPARVAQKMTAAKQQARDALVKLVMGVGSDSQSPSHVVVPLGPSPAPVA